METILSVKHGICVAAGVIGSVISTAVGGWTAVMTTLIICMGIDYVTGLIVAAVFNKSKKSKNGGLESKAGLKGILKKGVMLLIVIVGYRLDTILGSDYIKNAVIIAFITNEVISIIENAGQMGITLPKVLYKAIDVLEGKEEEKNVN